MNIGLTSMMMSRSKVQEAAGIAVMKIAMNTAISTGKDTANQMTEMLKSVAVDPNVGQNLDVKV